MCYFVAEMAEPIQQLTRNNSPQGRETIPFTLIQRKEKVRFPSPAEVLIVFSIHT